MTTWLFPHGMGLETTSVGPRISFTATVQGLMARAAAQHKLTKYSIIFYCRNTMA